MKIQKYLTVFLSGVFILIFAFWCFFITTPDFSESERRFLAKFPEISWQSISSGEFAKKFEEYTTDRFPFRDTWRSIKAHTRLNVLMQKENNNIFVNGRHISKLDYPEHRDMMDYSISLFNKIYKNHLQQNKVYFAVIPDKNKYIAELKFDYNKFEKYMHNGLPFATPIQLDRLLSADDYYFTDSHWRQDKITDVAAHIAQSMGVNITNDYQKLTLDAQFNGVYVGQSALKCKPDTINYLTNDIIKNLQVTGADAVYDIKKANGKDSYEMFLSGNQPLITINNPANTDGKRLIIFRDSFASSIAPLLAQAYSELVMIDLRYMNSGLLDQFVDFSNADVLFLYSSTILNNSTAMK